MQKNQVSTSAHLFYSYYLKCLFLILKCYFLSARLSGCLIFCPIVIVTVFLFLCVVLSLFVDKSTVKGCPCFFYREIRYASFAKLTPTLFYNMLPCLVRVLPPSLFSMSLMDWMKAQSECVIREPNFAITARLLNNIFRSEDPLCSHMSFSLFFRSD